jgi:hypothetical protein
MFTLAQPSGSVSQTATAFGNADVDRRYWQGLPVDVLVAPYALVLALSDPTTSASFSLQARP